MPCGTSSASSHTGMGISPRPCALPSALPSTRDTWACETLEALARGLLCACWCSNYSSALSTAVNDPCIRMVYLEAGNFSKLSAATLPCSSQSVHQENCYHRGYGQCSALSARQQERGWGLPVYWSRLTGDLPARGAPPLTISFTLPPSRSRTLLNTSLSNSGVACMPTPSLHASVSTSNPQCHTSMTCSSSSSAPACQWPLTSCMTPAVKRAYIYAIAASGSGQKSAAAAGISTYCPAKALQLAES